MVFRRLLVDATVADLKEKIGSDKVVMGLSGGVDSSVAATLIHRAIGDQLTCVFVDNGLLRKNEFEEVLDSYKHMGLNVIGVDSKQRFYDALEGITDPEGKRKAIGRVFIEVFDDESYLGQDGSEQEKGSFRKGRKVFGKVGRIGSQKGR